MPNASLNSASVRLNSFQRTMLQWDSLHPYNAVHVVMVPGVPDEEDLRRTITTTLKAFSLGGVILDSKQETYCHGGDASCEIRILDGGSSPRISLAGEIERQINTRFPFTGIFS